MEPIWEELSSELAFAYPNESVVIARVDCTQNPGLTKRFEIKGYPTIQYFADRAMYTYRGSRDVSSLLDFVIDTYNKDGVAAAQTVPPPPSFLDDMLNNLRHTINTNPEMKALIEDLEHISQFRKNAAILFLFMGFTIGICLGYLIGYFRTNNHYKIKKD